MTFLYDPTRPDFAAQSHDIYRRLRDDFPVWKDPDDRFYALSGSMTCSAPPGNGKPSAPPGNWSPVHQADDPTPTTSPGTASSAP